MLANALRVGLNLSTKLNLHRGSRRAKLAATAAILLVVGPSFFGVVASSHRPPAHGKSNQVAANQQDLSSLPPIQPLENLVSMRATGVPTLPLLVAGERFYANLTPAEQARSTFPATEAEWLDLMNASLESRSGLTFAAMTPDQREAVLSLIQASLSLPGLNSDHGVDGLWTALSHHPAGLTLDGFTLLGRPAADAAWGWQVAAPYLTVTCFVAGDQVVITPTVRNPSPSDHLAQLNPPTQP